MRRATVLLLVLLAGVEPARAHEGPPYPIAMDEPVGPYEVSVWTDPDVGTGTFWVVLKAALPGTTVQVEVRPRDRAGDWVAWPARLEPSREGELHVAEVPFDRAEWSGVRIVVDGPQGGGRVERDVEVTPPGMGPWLDFTLYLFPFVAVGLLLLKAALKRRELRAAATGDGTSAAPERSADD